MNRIIYEDNHLIAVTKKSGEIVQGDKTTINRFLKKSNYLKLNIKNQAMCF